MSKNRRPAKKVTKKIVVYCEGDTEEHYITGLKAYLRDRDESLKIKIDPKPIGGGGYKDIVERLSGAADAGCIARVVLFDFDRFLNHHEEKENFSKLLNISSRSTSNRVPCILVGANPKYEYVLCCHDPKYKERDIEAFLKEEWGYSSLKKCKGDKKVWEKANKPPRSYKNALCYLDTRPIAIQNSIRIVKRSYSVHLDSVDFDEEKLAGKTSNIVDLFKVIGLA